jgi:cytochrome c
MRQALLIIALLSPAVLWTISPRSPAAAPRPVDPAVERGHGLAARRCAECHAIGASRDSPDGDAPPFAVLHLRYTAISLERRLDGIPWGEHAGMPPIGLSSADRKDLAAYIENLHSPGA